MIGQGRLLTAVKFSALLILYFLLLMPTAFLLLAVTSEEMIPIRVDLPAPFGPSRAKKSPSATLSEVPFSASTPLL